MVKNYSTRAIEEIDCPFCKVGKLKVLYEPSTLRFKTTHSGGAGTKRKAYRTQESYSILSDKCPNCGKSKKQIEKALKEEPKFSHEEIISKAKEAGLPLKIR